MGLDVEVDPDSRTIFVKKFENCECCHGLVNSCDGEFCANLGLCFCVTASLHNDSSDEDDDD